MYDDPDIQLVHFMGSHIGYYLLLIGILKLNHASMVVNTQGADTILVFMCSPQQASPQISFPNH